MAHDITKLREVTKAAFPINDKLISGDTNLNEDEVRTMRKAFETWRHYLDSM